MRHRLDAGSKFTGRGLFIRSARPVEFRITARAAVLVMIAALVLPTFFIAASNNTMAARNRPASNSPDIGAARGLWVGGSELARDGHYRNDDICGRGRLGVFYITARSGGDRHSREPSPAERTLNKATNAINSL